MKIVDYEVLDSYTLTPEMRKWVIDKVTYYYHRSTGIHRFNSYNCTHHHAAKAERGDLSDE